MKKFMCRFLSFILINCFALGFMQVYKASYNTMNSEHIKMADILLNNTGNTEFKILDKSFEIEISPENLKPDDKMKYTIYAISDGNMRNIISIMEYAEKYFIDFFNNI